MSEVGVASHRPTILTDGSLDDLVPTPVPALTYTTAMSHLPSSSVRDHMKWAGLLGCEAVLSSMALMQASTMAAPPKKMMAPLGHVPPQREGPDRAPQSHMILPSGMSCPPLLIRKEGEFPAPRLLDEKEMRANEDMQQKKKNRKSVTPCKGADGDENGPSSKVQKNFICDHCYGAFKSGYHLKRHILIHTGVKPYACSMCDMRFFQRYHLARHTLTHTGVKPYACTMCDMRFIQRYQLERHSLTHTGVKPYACTMCDKRFFQRYHLARHSLIHMGEKPFACDMCDMRFIQRYHLERHKRVHSGEKPYQCERCQQNFSRTDRLLRHRRLCQGRGVAKVENQPCCEPRPYPQEPPPAPPTWSPLHPPPGRLAV
uniref:Zinc finger protein 740 n=1 Tax=Nothobranchius furzeri TaxID=105023 RepID=A0A1A7ZUJ5_NOTFU